ncbi:MULTISPECIES: ATP-binding cassette domain-containing protein [unclassified Microbacterium]|uniref:ATP-binding cassette domain-containing protein n=1 Tax=unclassified Microbacterium TaxID=2609290 RepID=UPI00301A5AA8
MSALLDVRGVSKVFAPRSKEPVIALDGVDLSIGRGRIRGLVGESGSGKSTLIRSIIGLEKPSAGEIVFDGVDMVGADRDAWTRFRQSVQTVFQDPFSSLNPRMTVERIVGEGLIIHGKAPLRAERRVLVAEALQMVGLDPTEMTRYPGSFSGGQRQRIAIARAIVMRPRLLICDEPVSALDVSVQAQVVNLLKDMQQKLDLTMLFVAHDLAVVRYLCDDVTVLHRGHVVDEGDSESVFTAPRSDYTRSLIDASPIPDPSVPYLEL